MKANWANCSTRSNRGLTLVELLIAMTVVAMISVVAAALLQTSLQAHAVGLARAELYHEGAAIMDRITNEVRRSTFVMVPNAHSPTRGLLICSGRFNDDDDYYFNDPLFPRIDEDIENDMNNDGASGVKFVDDDGDIFFDESWQEDDDEDGTSDEEIYDGFDNDGDGNVDEDLWYDMDWSGLAGIAGMDDDGDGTVDEGDEDDDDEDGSTKEDRTNGMIFWRVGAEFYETAPSGAFDTLSDRVTSFEAFYAAPQRIRFTLTLTNSDGKSVTFQEFACPRNIYQRTGRRVR